MKINTGSPDKHIIRRWLFYSRARQHAATTLPACLLSVSVDGCICLAGRRLRASAHQAATATSLPVLQYTVTSLAPSCDLGQFTLLRYPSIYPSIPPWRLAVCLLRAARCQCCIRAPACRPATTTKTTWGCARANTPSPTFCAHRNTSISATPPCICYSPHIVLLQVRVLTRIVTCASACLCTC